MLWAWMIVNFVILENIVQVSIYIFTNSLILLHLRDHTIYEKNEWKINGPLCYECGVFCWNMFIQILFIFWLLNCRLFSRCVFLYSNTFSRKIILFGLLQNIKNFYNTFDKFILYSVHSDFYIMLKSSTLQ